MTTRRPTASRLRNEAAALLRNGDPHRAGVLLEQALRIEPGHPGALANLGTARRRLGDLQSAISCYREALRQGPVFASAGFNLANALKDAGEFDEAIGIYRQVLERHPDHLQALNNLGIAYKQCGASSEAEATFRQALSIDPDYGPARRNLGAVHEDNGEFEKADECYRRAWMVDANDAKALAKIIASRTIPVEQECLDAASRLLDQAKIDKECQAQLHYGLGRYHDRQGQYELALPHFRRANEIKSRERPFPAAAVASKVDEICAVFTPELFKRFSNARLESDKPVFIVGMPRTGTTLTEQILASHPDIAGGGELPYFGAVALDFRARTGVSEPFPSGVGQLTVPMIKAIGLPYLEKLDGVSAAASRVTDKMPQNFLYLGLIALLFSSARVIHCWRDPRDVCLSCFVEDFNVAHGFASDARHFAAYYRQYCRLMAHWHRVLPLPIFDLRYEDMVADSRAMSRKLLEFVGCEWDERCARFYEQERVVTTPSRWQVRQPIYSHSIGRWRHYREFLEPVLADLEALSPYGASSDSRRESRPDRAS